MRKRVSKKRAFLLQLVWAALIGFVLASIVSGIDIFDQGYALSEEGYGLQDWLWYFRGLSTFIFYLAVATGVAGLLIDDIRRLSALILVACVVFWVGSGFLHAKGEDAVWTSAMNKLNERSLPLVSAIVSFDKEQGRPPENLLELVPWHVYEIPNTGIGASPDFIYVVGDEAQRKYDKPWVLYVDLPSVIGDEVRCVLLFDGTITWECRAVEGMQPFTY
jgi:hypothetical protein